MWLSDISFASKVLTLTATSCASAYTALFMTVRIINHSTIGCRCSTVVKGVGDGSCDEYDFADAGLRLASANAQGNVPSLDFIFTVSVIGLNISRI